MFKLFFYQKIDDDGKSEKMLLIVRHLNLMSNI